jgi:transposase
MIKEDKNSEHQRKLMFRDYCNGMLLQQIAEKYGISERTVRRNKEKEEWDSKKAEYLSEKRRLASLQTEKDLTEEARIKVNKLLLKFVEDLERIGEVEGYAGIPMKLITDAVDKLSRLQTFKETGGVDKKELTVTSHKIDWAEVVRATHQIKQQNPDTDIKDLMEKITDPNIVDAEFKDVKE